MIVRDLIAELEQCDPEAEIVVGTEPVGATTVQQQAYRDRNEVWIG